MALGVECHGDQGNGHLLASGQQLVHFAFGHLAGVVAPNLFGQINEFIGRMSHRGDDDNDLIPGLFGRNDLLCGLVNPLGIGDGRAAEFLNN